MTFNLYRIDDDTETLIDTVEIKGGTFNENTSLQAVFEDVLIYYTHQMVKSINIE